MTGWSLRNAGGLEETVACAGFTGPTAAGTDQFLASTHAVDCRLEIPDNYDVQLVSSPQGSASVDGIEGHVWAYGANDFVSLKETWADAGVEGWTRTRKGTLLLGNTGVNGNLNETITLRPDGVTLEQFNDFLEDDAACVDARACDREPG